MYLGYKATKSKVEEQSKVLQLVHQNPIHNELKGDPLLLDFETNLEEFDEINENTIIKILHGDEYLQ